jgi:serine protease inhibitor
MTIHHLFIEYGIDVVVHYFVFLFALSSLFQAVAKKDGNVFISPISVEVVLALAYMGAAGNTAEQIASVLHLPTDREDVKAGFLSLLGLLKVRNDR